MVSMFIPLCPFCDHTNPAGAKFCNDCGSPLHLKPCKRCDTINDADARYCYECGAADPALIVTPHAAVVAPGAERTASPDLDSTAKRRPVFRVAMATMLPVVLFSAVAIAAYYVGYHHPVQLGEWLSGARAIVSPGADVTTIPAIPGTSSMPAPNAPTLTAGTAGVAAMKQALPPPANEPATEITRAPARQDSAPATAAAGGDGRTQTSGQDHAAATSQPQVSTGERAAPAPPVPPVAKKSSTGTKTTATQRKKAAPKKPVPTQATPMAQRG
jgi:hypothetical protein